MPIQLTSVPEINIRLVKDACTKLIENPIIRDLTICQAILESRLEGKPSILAYNSNNLFGIKAGGSVVGTATPPVVKLPTYEYLPDGTKQLVLAEFVKNNTISDSIAQHNLLLADLPRYHNLWAPNITFEEAAHLIQEDGYATDPHYPQLLIDIYNRWCKSPD